MNSKQPFPRGLGVAMVTPFDENGKIDFPALGSLVDYVIAGGVDYIVALGTTAETPTLFADERNQVLEHIKKQTAGRVPVVVGIGGNNTAGVIAAINGCDMEGVEAVLSVTPFYNKPSQRGLYEHYMAIAKASPLPVILYNVPGRTGVNMLPETTIKLAEDSRNIIAIKEACGDMAQFEKLLAGSPEGFSVVSGDDCTAVPLIEMGGHGLISVAANAFPSYIHRMLDAALEGRKDECARMWNDISAVGNALFEEGNPTGVKAMLTVQGLIKNHLRLPLVAASDAFYAKIEQMLAGGRFS